MDAPAFDPSQPFEVMKGPQQQAAPQQPQGSPQMMPTPAPQQTPMMQGAQQPISPQRMPNLQAATQPPQQAQQQPQAPQFDPSQPFEVVSGQQQQAPENSWKGAGKAALQGGVNAVSGLAGIPGDALSLVTGGKYGSGFGSEAIQKGIEGYTGHYDPQTRLEKYIRTGTEFGAGMAFPAGDISTGAKLLRLVAAPAIASETAGQLTEGTAAEPYARIAGGVIGGAAAGKIGDMLNRRPAPTLITDPDQLKPIAKAGYQSPDLSGVQFKDEAISDLQDKMRAATLPREVAAMPHGAIDMLNQPIAGKANFGWDDVQRARDVLTKETGNFANPVSQGAAGTAKAALDDWLDNLHQGQLTSGNARVALQTYRTANTNYQVMSALNMLQGKEYAAELGAAAANSGANFENAMRQRIKGVLVSPAQRAQFASLPNGDQIIEAMEDVVRGGRADNLLRGLSNILGGGGGMHAGWMGLAGVLSGHPETIAAPLAGMAIKGFQSRRLGGKLDNITNMIASQAPANPQARTQAVLQRALQGMPSGKAAGMTPMQRAIINAALSRQSATQQTLPTMPPLPQ